MTGRLTQFLVGIPGALVGTALAGPARRRIGPLLVSVRLRPSLRGGSRIEAAPLGELRLDTHDGPVEIHAMLQGVDEGAARNLAVRPESLHDLSREAQAAAPRAVARAAARSIGAAAAGGAATGLLAFRRPGPAAVSSGAGAATVLAACALSARTFRRAALREPQLTGLLAGVPSLKGMVEELVTDVGVYGEQLAKLLRNARRMHAAVSDLPLLPPSEQLVTVLHVSDLHLAPQVWKIVAAAAEEFAVDLVVDSGDTTDFGSPLENAYLARIGDLGRPYVWIRGNHDSDVTAQAMRALPNVVVLDGQVEEVAGLRFAGAADPVFTPGRSHLPMDLEAEAAAARSLAATARQAGGVDVAVFHHPGPWHELDGVATTVLAGHRHVRNVERSPGGTLLMVLGSTGGGGFRALQGKDEATPVELAVLYFDRLTKRVVAWDDIRLGGVGQASASVERRLADAVPPGR